jgi:hypothetical protein
LTLGLYPPPEKLSYREAGMGRYIDELGAVWEVPDEVAVRDALYGPQTRSGNVTKVPRTVYAVAAPIHFSDGKFYGAGFHTVEPWIEWEQITWPFYEGRMHRLRELVHG